MNIIFITIKKEVDLKDKEKKMKNIIKEVRLSDSVQKFEIFGDKSEFVACVTFSPPRLAVMKARLICGKKFFVEMVYDNKIKIPGNEKVRGQSLCVNETGDLICVNIKNYENQTKYISFFNFDKLRKKILNFFCVDLLEIDMKYFRCMEIFSNEKSVVTGIEEDTEPNIASFEVFRKERRIGKWCKEKIGTKYIWKMSKINQRRWVGISMDRQILDIKINE